MAPVRPIRSKSYGKNDEDVINDHRLVRNYGKKVIIIRCETTKRRVNNYFPFLIASLSGQLWPAIQKHIISKSVRRKKKGRRTLLYVIVA